MSFYENVFIARQDISASAVDSLTDRFAAIIAENGGSVPKKENWGLRNLSYKIKKNRKGHYVLFNIDAPPAAIQEMERQMRINEDILRFLTVKVEALDPNPSAVMQSRSTREDRPRRERRFGGPEGDEGVVGEEEVPAVVGEQAPIEAKGDDV